MARAPESPERRTSGTTRRTAPARASGRRRPAARRRRAPSPGADDAVHYEHLILGGGLCGLSLADGLVARGIPGAGLAIVEPLEHALEQRTFCCFVPRRGVSGAVPADAVTKRWPRWSLRAPGGHHALLVGHDHDYVHVDPRRLETILTERLRAAGVTFVRGERVPDDATFERAARAGLRVRTDRGRTLTARRIHDGRPRRGALADATLVQSFHGLEIVTERASFDPWTAVLMDFRPDPRAVEFVYLLPFDEHRALVEATSFEALPAAIDTGDELARRDERLRAETMRWIEANVPGRHAVARSESGHLPMDARRPRDRRRTPGVARIGSAAGGLRPATGYGFLPNRRFAARYADRLVRDPDAEPPRYFPAWLRWLDGVFLHRLAADPAAAPRAFVDLAHGLGADGFARLLSETPTRTDLVRLLTALPTAPMLGSAIAHTLGRGARRGARR